MYTREDNYLEIYKRVAIFNVISINKKRFYPMRNLPNVINRQTRKTEVISHLFSCYMRDFSLIATYEIVFDRKKYNVKTWRNRKIGDSCLI